jgi:hypothetical protein
MWLSGLTFVRNASDTAGSIDRNLASLYAGASRFLTFLGFSEYSNRLIRTSSDLIDEKTGIKINSISLDEAIKQRIKQNLMSDMASIGNNEGVIFYKAHPWIIYVDKGSEIKAAKYYRDKYGISVEGFTK